MNFLANKKYQKWSKFRPKCSIFRKFRSPMNQIFIYYQIDKLDMKLQALDKKVADGDDATCQQLIQLQLVTEACLRYSCFNIDLRLNTDAKGSRKASKCGGRQVGRDGGGDAEPDCRAGQSFFNKLILLRFSLFQNVAGQDQDIESCKKSCMERSPDTG